MTDEEPDADQPASDAEEHEYPKAPGASKMEALERIERSLERQSEHTADRSEADARESADEDPAPTRDSGD